MLNQRPLNKIIRNIFLQGPCVGFHANKLMVQKQFGTQWGQCRLASDIAQATGSTDEAGTEGNNFCYLVTTLLGQCFASKSKMTKKDATFSRDYYCPLITWDTELLGTHNTIPCLLLKSGFRFSCPSAKTRLPFPWLAPSQVSQESDVTRDLHVTGELPISALCRKFQFPLRCSLRIFMLPPCSSNSILHLL